MAVLISLLLTLRDGVRSRTNLQLEVLALRHQLHVLKRAPARGLQLTRFDRLRWVWLSRVWDQWWATLVLVKPETVITWHRRGFRLSLPRTRFFLRTLILWSFTDRVLADAIRTRCVAADPSNVTPCSVDPAA
jgi:hypothetical protein